MVANLAAGRLDAAVALTEGLVLAGRRGELGESSVVSVFVESPLQWGVHVRPGSEAERADQLDPRKTRIAISRHLSGSHLMSWVFAKQHGWPADQLNFVVVGGLTGALKAFEEDRVDLFLWDRFMTAPVVHDGKLKLIGQIDSPWPCFCVAARNDVMKERGEEVHEIVRIVLREGRRLKRDPDNVIAMLQKLHRLSEPVAREWLEATVYAKPHELPEETVQKILAFIPHNK